jgi:undecaprenyl-diphosphatase
VRQEPSSGHPSDPATPPTLTANSLQSRAAGRPSRLPRSRLVLVAGGFVALFASLLVLGAIAEDVHEQEANALDALATPLLHALSNPTLDAIMAALTDLGSTIVVAPLFVVALVLLIWRRHRREALFLAVSMAGSLGLNQSLKLIFNRPRPQLAWAQVQPEYSFPSGHAMNSLVFYVAVALIVWVLWGRRAGLIAGVVAIVLALLIGTSRIYLGYHYFTDVVGGLVAGTAWLLMVAAAFRAGPEWRHTRGSGARGSTGSEVPPVAGR